MKLKCSQMIGNESENQYIKYDVYGKVTTIYSDAGLTIPVVEYSYDDKGFRYLVETPDGKRTFYVRDLSGNIISIYDDKITAELVQKVPIYGALRLGTVDLNSGWGAENYIFELSDHLGNVRATFTKDNDSDGKPDLLSYSDYYPGGMLMPGRQFVAGTGQYRFGYQGQFAEKDQETGYNHFELRLYDSRILRWHSTDPYGQYYSPYLGMGNNPINGVDPNGGITNPIYDWLGNFLGTDDLGLQGEAIIMDADNFTQGMSNADAMAVGFTLDNMSWGDALSFANNGNFENFMNHFNSLSSRPDWDGFLTKAEADAWWQSKSGQSLFVDQSKIELPGINTSSFKDATNNSISKNFILGLSNTGKVYGTLKMTLTNSSTGSVFIGNQKYMDKYDFEMDGRAMRDFATWWGRPGGANSGNSFLIHGYGRATVPVKK